MLLRQTWQAADKGRLKARRGDFVSSTRPRVRVRMNWAAWGLKVYGLMFLETPRIPMRRIFSSAKLLKEY